MTDKLRIIWRHLKAFVIGAVALAYTLPAGLSQSAHQWEAGSFFSVTCVAAGCAAFVALFVALISNDSYMRRDLRRDWVRATRPRVRCEAREGHIIVKEHGGELDGHEHGSFAYDDEEGAIDCMNGVLARRAASAERQRDAERLAATLNRGAR